MLEFTQLFAYTSALGMAAAIPGPGMTALVARSISGGATIAFAMLAGVILGDLVYLSFAVFGLAALSNHFSALIVLIFWGSSLYLTWLSWQFLTYVPNTINIDKKTDGGKLFASWLSGFTITLGNPKTIAFYLAILPLVITLDTVSFRVWAGILLPLTAAVLLIVGSAFILGALKIRKILASPKAQTRLYRGAGCIMFAAAVSMMIKAI